MANKVLRSVFLDLDQVKKIKKLSEITKVPQAEYIREAMDMMLHKYKRRLR
jgi:predicted DNA-binding protein